LKLHSNLKLNVVGIASSRNAIFNREGLDLDYVREGARDLHVTAALSNSFGFGGHNGTLCIRRYEA